MFGAIGKTSAFRLISVLWLTGAAGGKAVVIASGDLLLSMLFLWCLRGGRPMASGRARA